MYLLALGLPADSPTSYLLLYSRLKADRQSIDKMLSEMWRCET